MEGFSAKIVDASRDLTAREKISLKDFSDAISLDEATQDGPIVVVPDVLVTLEIHNEHSAGDKDYKKHVLLDTEGNKYVTGSDSFQTAMCELLNDIADLKADGEEEEFSIKIYRRKSKNYAGKTFITCSLN